MNYARAIRVARAIKGISQQELAHLSERSASSISLLESGKKAPSQKTLQAIADGLHIPRISLTLLASEAADLRGVPNLIRTQATGSALLGMLFSAEDEGVTDE